MANVPTIVVGTGNQKKVVTPALLTGLDPNGLIVALQVDASGNLLTSGGAGGGSSTASLISSAYMTSDGFALLDAAITDVLYSAVDQATAIYNISTGIFTVPSTGVYMFSITTLSAPAGTPTTPFPVGAVFLTVNDTLQTSSMFPLVYNEAQEILFSGGVLVTSLQLGDEVKVSISQSMGYDSLCVSTSDYNTAKMFKL